MTQNVLKLVHFEPGFDKSEGLPNPGKIGIEVETQLSKVEFVWRAFENFATGHVFQSFNWVSIWHSTVGRRQGMSPHIVIGRGPGGAVMFLLPLCIRRRFGLTVLEWLGGQQADVKAGLFDKDFLRRVTPEDWAEIWPRICDKLPRFDLVHLTDQPERLDGVPNPFVSLRTHRQADQIRGTRLLGDWKSYCDAKRPPVWVLENPRRGRALDNLGDLRFEIARDPGRVTELLQKLFAGKAKLSRRKGLNNPLADAAARTFHWRQAQRMYPHGPAHLAALTLDGKPIAIDWGLIFRGHYYYLLSAYDTKLHRFSPETRLLNEHVRWCLEHGLERFDFGMGGHERKYSWCEEHVDLFSIINGCGVKGRVARVALGFAVRMRRLARTSKMWRRLTREWRVLIRPPARLRDEF